jgi:hypothetical protein
MIDAPKKPNVPDFVAAAKSLNIANTAIKEAVAALHRPDGSEALWEVANRLGAIAEHLSACRLLAAMKTSPVDLSAAGRALGHGCSDKKRAALVRNRQKLAEARLKATADREMRERVAPSSRAVN